MREYDYIITGAGASGLMLAYRMAKDPFFRKKKILIIDKENKTIPDHIWCYWEKEKDLWEPIVSKKWNQILFSSQTHTQQSAIAPYEYKRIHSKDFYTYVWKVIEKHTNIDFVQDILIDIKEEATFVQVQTENAVYNSKKVLNSILLDHAYRKSKSYPLINQHFVGWFIKASKPSFDPTVATFMDFDIPQNRNTRFMYVLPTSSTEALLEYTLFSKDLLKQEAYENAIKSYLLKKEITDYEILEVERGSIPMTSYNFHSNNSEHILHIGTAGGWTKASTGYTFRNASKKTAALIPFLKTQKPLHRFAKRTKFWFYDLLLLDILATHNEKGAALFSSMFQNGKVTRIFKFLDEETSYLEDLKIINSMPKLPFIKALFSRIVKLF